MIQATCIRDGCGMPFDPSEPETRDTSTLRAFWRRYCPKHRVPAEPPVIVTEQPAPSQPKAQPWGQRLWPTINRRRGELIDRQIAGTATTEELAELAMLQEYAEVHLEQFDLPKLEAIKARLHSPALLEALNEALGWLDQSDVRYLISHKLGEQAALHSTINKARKAIHDAQK
jgi:hypothetical protein